MSADGRSSPDPVAERARTRQTNGRRRGRERGEHLWPHTAGWNLSRRIRDVLNQLGVPLATPYVVIPVSWALVILSRGTVVVLRSSPRGMRVRTFVSSSV